MKEKKERKKGKKKRIMTEEEITELKKLYQQNMLYIDSAEWGVDHKL